LDRRTEFDSTGLALRRRRLDVGGMRPVDHAAGDAARQNKKLAPAHSIILVSDTTTLVPRREFVQ
jgi:hypothetical protein